jgi:hypothetical protein
VKKSLLYTVLMVVGILPFTGSILADDASGSSSSSSSSSSNSSGSNAFSTTDNPFGNINPQEMPWQKSRFSIEMQGGSKNLGDVDALLPFLGNDDFLIYTNLSAQAATDNSFAGGIGLGFRRVNDAENGIFGMYGFYDVLRSDSGNQYTQATIGLEHLGLTWDFRVNGYLPIGITSYQKNIYTGDSDGQIVIHGHDWLAHMQTETETANGGADLELGRTLGSPNMRGYLAGYYYGANVAGPRVRVEYQYNNRITLTGLVQYDQERGAQSEVGIRLTIGGSHAVDPNSIYSRMTSQVTHSQEIATVKTYSAMQDVVVKDRFYEVDPDSTGDPSLDDGTAEHPYHSLADAIANAPAGAIIFVKGKNGDISVLTNAQLKPGQILWGANQSMYWDFLDNRPSYTAGDSTLLVQGDDGTGSTNNKKIQGSLITADNTGIYNFDFTIDPRATTPAPGITINGSKGVTIDNVNMDGSGSGNTPTAVDGISIQGGAQDILIENVNVTGYRNGISIQGATSADTSVTLNNVTSNGNNVDGLSVTGADGKATTVTAKNSSFNGNTAAGISATDSILTLSTVDISGNHADGIDVSGGSTTINNASTIKNNTGNGYSQTNSQKETASSSLSGVTIDDNGFNGILLTGGSLTGTGLTLDGNDTSETLNDAGINIQNATAEFTNTTVINTHSDGVSLQNAAVKFHHSNISDNAENGIYIEGGTVSLTLDSGTTLTDNVENGIASSDTTTHIDLTLDTATITDNGGSAFDVKNTTANITNSNINHNSAASEFRGQSSLTTDSTTRSNDTDGQLPPDSNK